MFSPDVISLREFYATPLGKQVQTSIADAITKFWPEIKDDAILAIGYALPYVERYRLGAASLVVCMPAEQGAAAWPHEAPNSVLLAHESELPFQQNSINRVLLIHSVEHSEQLSGLMHEVWRVLTPGGRVLSVVPHRLSFWSGSSKSPFGFGRPFSLSQLRTLFSQHQLTITRTSSALFAPPFCAKIWSRLSRNIERIGTKLGMFWGGVILVEAEKQIYASIKQPALARSSYRLLVPAIKPLMQHHSKETTKS